MVVVVVGGGLGDLSGVTSTTRDLCIVGAGFDIVAGVVNIPFVRADSTAAGPAAVDLPPSPRVMSARDPVWTLRRGMRRWILCWELDDIIVLLFHSDGRV